LRSSSNTTDMKRSDSSSVMQISSTGALIRRSGASQKFNPRAISSAGVVVRHSDALCAAQLSLSEIALGFDMLSL
jgi:hypothetical protein